MQSPARNNEFLFVQKFNIDAECPHHADGRETIRRMEKIFDVHRRIPESCKHHAAMRDRLIPRNINYPLPSVCCGSDCLDISHYLTTFHQYTVSSSSVSHRKCCLKIISTCIRIHINQFSGKIKSMHQL